MEKLGTLSRGKYRLLHDNHPKWFPGRMTVETAEDIADLVHHVRAKRLLDYGCGKGAQYLIQRIHLFWGGIFPECYDPGVAWLDVCPVGTFDGIICTDVMEHIDENEVDLILRDIFSFLAPKGFAYFKISTVPAKKHDDDGVNLHVTVRSESWWEEKIERFRTNKNTVVVICTQ